MASTINKEDGRKLVACMVFCLRANGGRPLFGWFDLTDDEKTALKGMLDTVFRKSMDINMDGLETMLETFLEITNTETMEERNGRSWAAVANNKEQLGELKFDTAGRKAWYLSLKGINDPDWDGDKEPSSEEQFFLTKL